MFRGTTRFGIKPDSFLLTAGTGDAYWLRIASPGSIHYNRRRRTFTVSDSLNTAASYLLTPVH